MDRKPTQSSIGPWSVTSVQSVFVNPWISVIDHKVIHPNGDLGEYGVVRFKNRAVGVLPILDSGNVILVGQHRFPLDAYSWEIPEGGGEKDEDTLSAAKRELAEETGYTAKNWLKITEFDVSNSVTDECAVCYLAWNLSAGDAHPENSEELKVRQLSFTMFLEEVLNGDIRDSLSIVACLAVYVKALRNELPATISKQLDLET